MEEKMQRQACRILWLWTVLLVLGGPVPGGRGQDLATLLPDGKLRLPLGLNEADLIIPDDNPLTLDKIALGQQLYFDPRLSADGTVACASCHSPRFGFTDGHATSTGIQGQKGGRSAPTTINRVFSTLQFWDGRAASLEEQAKGPMVNPIEMGNSSHDVVVARLKRIGGYREAFQRAFGTEDFTIEHVAKAIACYERVNLSGNAPIDRFRAGDATALSAAAQRGLALFEGKARCTRCHTEPTSTDERFHNLGVGMDKPQPDRGRYGVTKQEQDRGAFKTPTLRDIALSAPYFHDGSAQTLEEVVAFYNRGGLPNPFLSKEIVPLHLTAEEQADLVAFLRALTGNIAFVVFTPKLPQ
jgi:cytochrome c peroxidase